MSRGLQLFSLRAQPAHHVSLLLYCHYALSQRLFRSLMWLFSTVCLLLLMTQAAGSSCNLVDVTSNDPDVLILRVMICSVKSPAANSIWGFQSWNTDKVLLQGPPHCVLCTFCCRAWCERKQQQRGSLSSPFPLPNILPKANSWPPMRSWLLSLCRELTESRAAVWRQAAAYNLLITLL